MTTNIPSTRKNTNIKMLIALFLAVWLLALAEAPTVFFAMCQSSSPPRVPLIRSWIKLMVMAIIRRTRPTVEA